MGYTSRSTYDFTGTGSLDAKFTQAGFSGTLTRASDLGNGNNGSAYSAAWENTATFEDNQYSQVVCKNLTSYTLYAAAFARLATGPDGYAAFTDGDPASSFPTAIGRYDNGSETVLWASTVMDFANDDVLRFVANRDTFWIEKNGDPSGVLVVDDTYSTGRPGPGVFGSGSAVDDWEGGDYAADDWEFIGYASTPADTGSEAATTVAVTPPSGAASGDLVVIIANTRADSGSISMSEQGGQTWTTHAQVQGTNSTTRLFSCVFDGTWDATPSVSFPSSVCETVVMLVYRPADTIDGSVDNTFAGSHYTNPSSPYDVTISGITTTQDGSLVLAIWTSDDNNTWELQTSPGWIHPGLPMWRNLAAQDSSISVCRKVQTPYGSTGNVTNRQVRFGADEGSTMIGSFKGPAAGALYQEEIDEGAEASDEFEAKLDAVGALDEGAEAGETIAGLLDTAGAIDEGAEAGETLAGLIDAVGVVDEGVEAGETVDGLVLKTGAVDEGVEAGEILEAEQATAGALDEGVEAGDVQAAIATLLASLDEGAEAGEAVAGGLATAGAVDEGVEAGETFAGAITTPHTDLTHFQFMKDDAVNPEDCTPLAGVDVAINRAGGLSNRFMVRFCIQLDATAAMNSSVLFKYRRNGGAWWTVGATTEVVYADGQPADDDGSGSGGLLGGTGTYAEGYYNESGPATPAIAVPVSGNTEVQICVYLNAGDLLVGDVIEFAYTTNGVDAEPATAYPSVTLVAVYQESIAEGVEAGDAEAALLLAVGALTDGAKGGEQWAGLLQLAAAISEGAKAGDVWEGALAVFKESIEEGLEVGDDWSTALMAFGALSEGTLAGEQLVAAADLVATVVEGAKVGDTASSVLLAIAAASEGAKAGDAWEGELAVFKESLEEGAEAGDSLVGMLAAVSSLQEGVTAGEVLAGLAQMGAAISEGIEAGDAWVGGLAQAAGMSDGVEASDLLAGLLMVKVSTTEGVKSSDLFAGLHLALGTVMEGALAGEVLTAALGALGAIAEGHLAGDLWTGGLLKLGSFTDGAVMGETFAAVVVQALSGLKIIVLQTALMDTLGIELGLEGATPRVPVTLVDGEDIRLPLVL